MHKFFVSLFLFIVVLAKSFPAFPADSGNQKAIEVAFRRGIQYLMTTSDPFYSAAEHLAERVGRECGHVALVKFSLDFRGVDEEDIFIGVRRISEAEKRSIEQFPFGTDKIFLKADHCLDFSYENFSDELSRFEPDGSYVSTHILMGWTKARNNQCYPEYSEEIDLKIEQLKKELTAAQIEFDDCSAENIDIYAQRAHVISDAGDPVKKQWVDTILRCQQADGGWFTPHATGLSLITLANAMGDCRIFTKN